MPILIVCFLLLPLYAFAEPITVKVIKVVDADTLYINHHGQKIKIRLYGIDAPEKNQAYGEDATNFMKELVLLKKVKTLPITKDRYGRVVAMVYVNNTAVQEFLIRNGLAWVYPRYCKNMICKEWIRQQKNAKLEKKGLWQTNAMPPWEWRR